MRRILCALAAVGALVGPVDAMAQNTDWNRYTLENLDGVHVRIEASDACGVAASDFEASTSLQLIESGVGVLTREEMLENLALPELMVLLDCTDGPSGASGYYVGLRVHQAAQMLRNTQITHPEAVTWYSNHIGVASGDAASALEEALTAELTKFAEAWTAVNADEEADGSR